METATLTRAMKREALRPFREEWQYTSGDEWGVAMGHWFGVAEVLYHAGEDLPREWQFRDSPCDHDPIAEYHAEGKPCPVHERFGPCQHETCAQYGPECECSEERGYVPFLDAGETGIAMLLYAGRVLDRLCGQLKRAGKDY